MDAVLFCVRMATPLVFGLGTVITIVALRRAPLGREDEDGFHYLESSHTPQAEPEKGNAIVPPVGLA